MATWNLTEWVNLVARPWDSDSLTVADQMELLMPGLIDHRQELPSRRRDESKQANTNMKRVKIEESQSCCCAICLEEFSVGSEACCVGCSHMYHDDCIVRWLKNNNSCPLCRHRLAVSSCS
ncbi:hypothetical protein CICLE_v10023541mg [Citrus x clementina]|uniref:RING-type E3 ubiquitin transferase n=1 Tax=Citrus clementina TaxID=85681 RepID=V4VJC4_CITCL|nr:E3 ubiquitin-protein ligase RNF181 [Citrus x clementina]ESR52784.1 hypothetical protein CICLE_v10023541mg [Citrus x clementina]